VGRQVRRVFEEFTPEVEPLSLDEAFLDVTGARRLSGSGARIAAGLRRQVLEQEGLACSVGVASNKFLAKLASKAAKPASSPTGPVPGAGVSVVAPGRELEFLRPLPVGALWGVGPRTLERLTTLGVRTVGDLAGVGEEQLAARVGRAHGRHLWQLARAIDDRPVVTDQQVKSIGHEETFAVDHTDPLVLRSEAVRMADAVAARLRSAGLAGRTVTLKIRFGDFNTITRSLTVEPFDSGAVVARVAKGLLDAVDPSPGVRLLGVSVSQLGAKPDRQLSLFDDDGGDEVSGAVDQIRRRFGSDAIGPAILLGRQGLRMKHRGDQQWGPSADLSGLGG
jgi:DNA polymerase-4